jgi:hypothetical protein
VSRSRIVRHEGVVAISNQQEHREVLDPAAKVAQEIQGCFVGPVNVFNNHNGERSHVAELLQQCAIQLISFRLSPAEPEEVAIQSGRDIEERPERGGRKQTITACPEPASLG